MSWPFHDDACCPIAKSSSELSITSRWVLAFGSIIFSTPALIHAPRHSRQPLRDIHSASGDSGERRLSMGKCQGQAGVLVWIGTTRRRSEKGGPCVRIEKYDWLGRMATHGTMHETTSTPEEEEENDKMRKLITLEKNIETFKNQIRTGGFAGAEACPLKPRTLI